MRSPTRDQGQAPSGPPALIRYVLLAVLIAATLVLIDLARTSTNPLNLVQPGLRGPSVDAFREDFPDSYLPDSVGLDGQQFYAVARDPFDLEAAAAHLGRPRYRLQRPLLSWLAWVGHPFGGGTGLIASFAAVGLAAVGVLSASVGSISRQLGGPVWPAALVGFFPGVWWSLRVTVADTLATGLALAVVALLLHDRTRAATAVACAAILAKETAILVLVGYLLADWRDRRRWYPVAAAGAVALSWAAFLRYRLPGDESIGELTTPFAGIVGAVRDRWLEGDELWGLLGTATALAAAAIALHRAGIRHPLGPAIILQLVFLSVANADVLGNDFGAGRAMLPLLSLSVIAIASPASADLSDPEDVRHRRRLNSVSAHGASGTAGPGR